MHIPTSSSVCLVFFPFSGEEVERQHQGMDKPGVLKDLEDSGEQGKMKETGCEIICAAQTTLVFKG